MVKYPDFDLIAKHLSSIEVAFVILFSHAKDENLVEFEMIEGTDKKGEVEIEDREFSGNFTWHAAVIDKRGDDVPSVAIEYSFSGGYYGGSNGSYWEPPEAPTDVLDSIDVETFQVYDLETDDYIDLNDKIVKKEEFGFTYQNMLDLATIIGIDSVSHEEFRDSSAEECVYRVIGKNHRYQEHKEWVTDEDGKRSYKVTRTPLPPIPPLEFPLKLKHKIDEILKLPNLRTRTAARKYDL